jgi:hypothetical protein
MIMTIQGSPIASTDRAMVQVILTSWDVRM